MALMLDNASNNNTMVERIVALAKAKGVEMDSQWICLRCLPHTIHLAALKVSIFYAWGLLIGGAC